jgi:DNA polymerase III beta subunit, central domain
MTTTISVPAGKLRLMLTAVLPHAGRDDTLPMINGVYLQAAAGVLYLAATDRYSLGVARAEIPGSATVPVPDQSALLPRKVAKALLRMLRGADGTAALAITDGRLSADTGDGTTSSWALPKTAHYAYADWRAMLHKMLTAEQAPLGDGHGADPAKLARFALDQEPLSWESLSIRVTLGVGARNLDGHKSAASPVVLVTRGTWFCGALMPTTHSQPSAGEVASAWADWAALTAPDSKDTDSAEPGPEPMTDTIPAAEVQAAAAEVPGA